LFGLLVNVSVSICGPLYEDSFSPYRWTEMVILKIPGTWDEKRVLVIWEWQSRLCWTKHWAT